MRRRSIALLVLFVVTITVAVASRVMLNHEFLELLRWAP